MRNLKIIAATMLAGAIIVVSMSSCSGPKTYTKKRVDVKAVYWHERNRYSVAIMDGDKVSLRSPLPYGIHIPIIIKADVADGESMWYEYSYTKGNSLIHPHTTGSCTIHIREVANLQTADWNHGKFGSGSTTRIDKKEK